MKLYFSPGLCSLAPHIVLRETGLSFALEKVNVATKKTETDADYLRINPKGYVPAIALDNGEVLTEVPVILQYIAEQKPAAALMPPPGSMERYRMLEWLNFIGTELHKAFGWLFSRETTEEFKPVAKARLARRFGVIEQHLSDGRAYLTGERFTLADAYCFVVVNWSHRHGIDLGQWPHLAAYISRVAARPKVQEAMKAEGLLP